MNKFRIVKPCGMLYSQGREYFLLHPYPIERDSWQWNDAYRWVVVPYVEGLRDIDGTYYPPARHIVSNAWTIEYMGEMPEIRVRLLEQNDVASLDWYVDPVDNMQLDFEDLVNLKLNTN